jgi:orotate phosphoribosyltransferase
LTAKSSRELDHRKALIVHLREHSLRTDGPFTLRSGATSEWYLDARQTTFDGIGGVLVGEAVLDALDAAVTAVGGMTMGADPVAMAVAMVAAGKARSLRAFSVRKEEKGHGARGRIAGPLRAGDVVAVVEDTTTTGSALMEAIAAVREAGAQVIQALSLVDRSAGLVGVRLAELGVAFSALALPEDLGVQD